MTQQLPSAIIAVFDDRGHAESAHDELTLAGFHHDQIGILMPGGQVEETPTSTERAEENAGRGAVAGAVAGGAVGTLAGALTLGLIPGIGPALAGGALMGVVLSGATGAALGSYLGPFLALGFSHDEARGFERELKAGRTLLTVRVNGRGAEALTILRAHGGHDGNLASFAEAHAPRFTHLQS